MKKQWVLIYRGLCKTCVIHVCESFNFCYFFTQDIDLNKLAVFFIILFFAFAHINGQAGSSERLNSFLTILVYLYFINYETKRRFKSRKKYILSFFVVRIRFM